MGALAPRGLTLVLTLTSIAASCGTAPSTLASLQNEPCPPPLARPDVFCGRLQVPEDRARPTRRIALHVVRIGAATPAAEAIVVLAGGPGQASTSLFRIADGWLRPARATHDVLFVDQRGTGGSAPLHCDLGVTAGPPAVFGHVFDVARVRACADTLRPRVDAAQYTTSTAADDLDVVRAALGYGQISLYGSSYGTRLAQTYQRRYPSRVRAMVLDGVVPDDVAIPTTYAATAQQALDRVFATCDAEADCRREHPDLRAAFARVLARFDAGPRATSVQYQGRTVPVSMTRGDFGYAVRGMLYQRGAFARLPAVIAQAAASGDVRVFAQAYWDRAAALAVDMSYGVHLSVVCVEDGPRAGVPPPGTGATFLGNYLIEEYRRACETWLQGVALPSAPPASPSIVSDVPVLLLSGEYDPVTPPAFGARVATTFSRSHHIVGRGAGHGLAPGCGAELAVQVLTSGRLEGLPSECR